MATSVNSLLGGPSARAAILLAPFPAISCDVYDTHITNLQPSSAFICTLYTEDESLLELLKRYAERRPVKLPKVGKTPFQNAVLEALKNIPWGETATYQEVAKAIGRPLAARAVGNACNQNPLPLLIPCHRVIASDGRLGGFASGLEVKKRLLEFEGSSGS